MIKQSHDLTLAEHEAHEKHWGNYNAFPPGWREIKAAEFAKSDFFGWTPVLTQYRQMIPNTPELINLMRYKDQAPGVVVSASLSFMPSGLGYAIVNDFWGGTIRYFQFGEQKADWLKGVDSSD
jgi:hypothetical protein